MLKIDKMIWFPKEVDVDEVIIRTTKNSSLVVSDITKELVYNSAVTEAGFTDYTVHKHRPLKLGDVIDNVDPEFAKVYNCDTGGIAGVFEAEEHKLFVERKKLRSAAKRVGLPVGLGYMLKYLNKDILKALSNAGLYTDLFLVKEDKFLKYFDSEGVYGMSHYDIQNAWFKSGCGVDINYFNNIIAAMCVMVDKYGRLDGYKNSYNVDIRVLPRKWLSIKNIVKYFEITSRLERNAVAISTRLLGRLVSLSYVNREVIIDYLIKTYNNKYYTDNLDEDDRSSRTYRRYKIYSKKHVKWELLKLPTYVKVGMINDKAYQWYWNANRLELSLTGIEAGMLRQLPSSANLNDIQITKVINNMIADDLKYNIELVKSVS